MKTMICGLIFVVGAAAVSTVQADQYLATACYNKQSGTARFVDGLKAKKQACKKAEVQAFYAKAGKIYDSNDQLLGYNFSGGLADPYNATVFVPSVGRYFDIEIREVYNPALLPDVTVGDVARYQTFRTVYYTTADCTGTGYVSYTFVTSHDLGAYRDPADNRLFEIKGTPVAITPVRSRFSHWEFGTGWVDELCGAVMLSTPVDTYLPYSPTEVTLPFTVPVKLPLVQK